MLFTADVSVPKNTTAQEPVAQILKIAQGIITKIMFRPRPGHASLAHFAIFHHEHQIAPSTENMWLDGDSFPIDWEEYYECYQAPYELKIKGWNEDDTYPHTATIAVVVLPRKALAPTSVADAIKNALGVLSPKRIFTAGG